MLTKVMKPWRQVQVAALALGMALSTSWVQAQQLMRWQTEQGAKVVFIESRNQPILDVRVDFNAGSWRDSPQKAGLSALTLSLLQAGTTQYSEQALAEKLADQGAHLSSSIETERAGLQLRTLSSEPQRTAALALLTDLLANPSFPVAAVEREKKRTIEGLKQAETDAASVADRLLTSAIYPNHPYGYEALTSIATVSRIQRADILAFWQQHYQAASATVTLVGDISQQDARDIAQSLTQKLPRPSSPQATLNQVPAVASQSLIKRPHPSSQVHIMLGMPLLQRHDPDYYPLLVGNYILGGGGFDSRLMKVLRDQHGLTYGVSSYMSPLREAGPFVIQLATEKKNADKAANLIDSVVQQFITQGPTAEELTQAKNHLIGGFPLRLDNNRKLLDYAAVIGFYGLPDDFLSAYTQRIAAVSREQIQQAFARRVASQQWQRVMVGVEP
ncbi:MAG: insulinase family protein [Aquaspirillum sp.]|nr:insulinase family protein [Aquaspirillum sp.]